MMRLANENVWGSIVVGLLAATVSARTVVLDGHTADRMAALHEAAPRSSWAAHSPRAGQFDTQHIDLTPESRFLIRFDLSVIPPRQRIAHAELTVPVSDFSGSDPRLFLWRTVAEWGVGVCHAYRLSQPEPVAWSMPGGIGAGMDRAFSPSAVARVTSLGRQRFNVTADVALWYAKAAPVQGWMLDVEDVGVRVRLPSPAWDAASQWILRITYEPE